MLAAQTGRYCRTSRAAVPSSSTAVLPPVPGVVSPVRLSSAWPRLANSSAEACEPTFTEHQWRFILAHEALHVTLKHHARVSGRDQYLFNLATDFVINGWLVEMGVGEIPEGLLLESQFTGMSSEEVYDDSSRLRPVATANSRPSAGETNPTSSATTRRHPAPVVRSIWTRLCAVPS
jgi:hypothetical protein